MSLKKYREINEYQNSIWNVIFLTRKVQQITSCSAIVYVFLQGVVTANKPRKAASIWKQQLLGWKTKQQIKQYCHLVLSSPRLNGNKAKSFQSNLLKQIFTQLWFTGKQFIICSTRNEKVALRRHCWPAGCYSSHSRRNTIQQRITKSPAP